MMLTIAGLRAVFSVMWQVDAHYSYYVGFGIPLILNAFTFYIAGEVLQPPRCTAACTPGRLLKGLSVAGLPSPWLQDPFGALDVSNLGCCPACLLTATDNHA